MSEYLSPGVYVEEVSFRSKAIEGVPTSITGFVGMTRFGPVPYPNGPTPAGPRLVTSFAEFQRVYGGLQPLQVFPNTGRPCYTAHAAKAFFDNGGQRLYVVRAFDPSGDPQAGIAQSMIPVSDIRATWRARWPGAYGNVRIQVQILRSQNLAVRDPSFGVQVRTATAGSVVEVAAAGTADPPVNAPLQLPALRVVQIDSTGKQTFLDQSGGTPPLAATDRVYLCTVRIGVTPDDGRIDTVDQLAADPRQERYIGKVLSRDAPEDPAAVIWFDYTPAQSADAVPGFLPAKLLTALRAAAAPGQVAQLTGGTDGALVSPTDLQGMAGDRVTNQPATGLAALATIEEISIVAAPDASAYADPAQQVEAAGYLLTHAEALRYRIAVLDAPPVATITAVRTFRSHFDSGSGALYYPWVEVLDPTAPPGAPRLQLPPSGCVAGIYARTDTTQGVHKAPANAVVLGITGLAANTTDAQQALLNPEGINVLRSFPGRGIRVWGARTLSTDPAWKYVNIRRLFIFLERSVDRGTQWAVFEPNGPALWANVQRTIADFLTTVWQQGMLMGTKPEEAFFVRCDRTTMTQADLDAGRLICLIGVAPIKPAEFVLFRIGQWTASAHG